MTLKKKHVVAAGLLLCLTASTLLAQSTRKEGIRDIKALCGCYDIRFSFAETFSPDKNYKFHDNYITGALEYVFPISETKDKIVLQHLLVMSDSIIIKHWRQDWLYENTDFYEYDKNNTWKYVTKPKAEVKGQWTQKVYQVDDSPRYEGSATWVNVDGKRYWESVADAPLPRREFTKRKDYNVMVRKNRQEVTEDGWIHEQDNKKVLRTHQSDQIIAEEKGWNTYTKTKDSECEPAKRWWEKNKAYWADVRAVWDELFGMHKNVALNMRVEGKLLYERLFALGKKFAHSSGDDARSAKKQIRAIIQKHLTSEQTLTASVK